MNKDLTERLATLKKECDDAGNSLETLGLLNYYDEDGENDGTTLAFHYKDDYHRLTKLLNNYYNISVAYLQAVNKIDKLEIIANELWQELDEYKLKKGN